MLEFLLSVAFFFHGGSLVDMPSACTCTAWFLQVGAGVDIQCDGECLGSDGCSIYAFAVSGDLIVNCACQAESSEDEWYSCGGRDCESGYRYKLVGSEYVPVGPWCARVRCNGACNPVAPPIGFYGPVCSCL